MMTVQARAYMNALWLFFALCVALAGVVVVMGLFADEVQKRKLVQPQLRSWSPERIKAELAEADTATDCSAYLGEEAAGVRCSVWQITESFGLMTIESK